MFTTARLGCRPRQPGWYRNIAPALGWAANCASFTNPGHRRSARIAEEHSLFEFFARAALLADLFHLLLHKRLKVAPRLNALLLRAEIASRIKQVARQNRSQPGDSLRLSLTAERRQVLVRFEQRLLHDIRRIDASRQPRIEPAGHHSLEPAEVLLQQSISRG